MIYRDIYLHLTSISRENIVLFRISTKIMDTTTSLKQTYYCKRATSNEGTLGICKKTRPRLLSLMIVSLYEKNVNWIIFIIY